MLPTRTPLLQRDAEFADLQNVLLFTLVRFAWSIRECRKDPDAIREKLLSFIFNVTPARQAGILPAVGHDVQFEPIASSGEGRQPQQLRVKTAILERVSAAGTAMLSPSRVCVPMRAFQTLQGIIYAETHEGEGFNTIHLELLTGIAAVAAIASSMRNWFRSWKYRTH